MDNFSKNLSPPAVLLGLWIMGINPGKVPICVLSGSGFRLYWWITGVILCTTRHFSGFSGWILSTAGRSILIIFAIILKFYPLFGIIFPYDPAEIPGRMRFFMFEKIKENWQEILEGVREGKELSEVGFRTWISPLEPLSLQDV